MCLPGRVNKRNNNRYRHKSGNQCLTRHGKVRGKYCSKCDQSTINSNISSGKLHDLTRASGADRFKYS